MDHGGTPRPGRVIRIAVALRAPLFRESVRAWLERAPDLLVAGEAGDAGGVVSLAGQRRPDVLILGTSIPELDVVEIVRRIRTDAPGTRLLVLVDDGDQARVRALRQLGARGFLPREATGEELVAAAREVAEGREVLVGEVAAGALTRAPVRLTAREHEVLRLLAAGCTNRQIAARLRIQEGTVEYHVHNLLTKLGAGRRTQAIHRARRLGLLGSDGAGGSSAS